MMFFQVVYHLEGNPNTSDIDHLLSATQYLKCLRPAKQIKVISDKLAKVIEPVTQKVPGYLTPHELVYSLLVQLRRVLK
jgi:hypothetical protein